MFVSECVLSNNCQYNSAVLVEPAEVCLLGERPIVTSLCSSTFHCCLLRSFPPPALLKPLSHTDEQHMICLSFFLFYLSFIFWRLLMTSYFHFRKMSHFHSLHVTHTDPECAVSPRNLLWFTLRKHKLPFFFRPFFVLHARKNINPLLSFLSHHELVT